MKVIFLTIHGMGEQKKEQTPKYSDTIESFLRSEIDSHDWGNSFVFRSLYYQDILQGNQERVFTAMRPHIDFMKLREFMLYGFSDATSLEVRKHEQQSAYFKVQKYIFDTLGEIYDAHVRGNEDNTAVFILAHSLGGQVLSNYLWDARERNDGEPLPSVGIWREQQGTDTKIQFQRLQSLHQLFTTGCNIPIFVSGLSTIQPLVRINDAFQWRNFYDADDVLGWPLRPMYALDALPQQYDYLEDIEVNAGGSLLGHLFKARTPLSHNLYWADSEVTGNILSVIREYL